MAMSADGKIAAPRSRHAQLGSEVDQARLHRLRAACDGVMCGATTLDREGATLVPDRREGRPFHRIAVTGSGSLSPRARLFREPDPPILVLTSEAAPGPRREDYRSLCRAMHVSRGRTIRWPEALDWLHRQWNIRTLMVEGGGTLNQSLFERDLIDEIHLTLVPFLIGGEDAPTIAEGASPASLAQAGRWRFRRRIREGNELFVTLEREAPG